MKQIFTIALIALTLSAAAQTGQPMVPTAIAKQQAQDYKKQKDSIAYNAPVLSMKDLRTITTKLQYLPAADWLKIVNILDQVYFQKVGPINPVDSASTLNGKSPPGNR